MAWVKLESSVSRNRKFLDAGPAASWLWLCGLVYCQEGLTDGFIPFQALEYLGVKSPSKHASRLVRAGLWDTCEGGWMIHDYLAHNKPAAEVRGIQQERRKNGAEGGKASGFSRRKDDAKQVASEDAEAPVEAQREPSTATNRSEANGSAPNGSEQPASRGHTGSGAMSGTLPREHLKHAWCGNYRKCVPEFLHGEFVRAVGGDPAVADATVKAFYQRTMDAIPDEQPLGDEATKFWRPRFAAAFPAPAVAAVPQGRMNPVDAWKARKAAEGRA